MIDEFAANRRIRELRDSLGLGRHAFSEMTGIEKRTIENIELEKQKVYAWHIEAIQAVWPQYGYWIATGLTLPNAGQISPEIEEARSNSKKAPKATG